MRIFLTALTLLTPFPVRNFMPTEKELEKCKFFIPIVGLLLGVFVALLAYILDFLFPSAIVAAILTIVLSATSKFFHLDGLADSADALFSGRSRERKLEIMRDSRSGPMGVAAIVALWGLKLVALSSLTPSMLPFAAFLAAAGGRCGLTMYIACSNYARQNGLAAIFYKSSSRGLWAVAFILLLSLAVIFCGIVKGGIVALAVSLWIVFWKNLTKSLLGGATGDTIGACEELTELIILLLLTMKI